MYKKRLQGWIKHLDFIIADILCLCISFAIAFIYFFGLNCPITKDVIINFTIIIIFFDFAVILFFDSMKNVLKRGYYLEFRETFKHVCIVGLIIMAYFFVVQNNYESFRVLTVTALIIYAVFSYCIRLLLKLYHKNSGFKPVGDRSLLIIACDKNLDEVLDSIKSFNYESCKISGIALLDKNRIGQVIEEIPIVADADTVINYICKEWVDEVFINLPDDMSCSGELLSKIEEMGVVVHLKLFHSIAGDGNSIKRFVERFGQYTVLTTGLNFITYRQAFIKRSLDILGGIVGCLITCVLFVILAPLIYIQSPGPIFFSQVRVGRNGKKFKIYKFRSMYMDAEERKAELMKQNRVKDGMMFKLDYDPRIIGCKKLANGKIKKGIGNYIRDWSLDEFPQFFNVLKNDMSLVGTRPPTLDEWEKYSLHHRSRLAVKPGITGMWQVNGRSNITDFEEIVALDTEYIKHWNTGLDIKILFHTIGTVFSRTGSM